MPTKTVKYLIAVLSLAAVVWSCSIDDSLPAPDQLVELDLSIDGAPTTRVAYTPSGRGSFDVGDQLSLTTCQTGKTVSPRRLFTVGVTQLKWGYICNSNADAVTFTAHYPAWQDSEIDSRSITNRALQADDGTLTDCLFAETVSDYSTAVKMHFAHRSARVEVRVSIVGESGATAYTGRTVELSNVAPRATQSWDDGVLVADNSATKEDLTLLEGASTASATYYTRLVVPQSLAGCTLSVDNPVMASVHTTLPVQAVAEAGKALIVNALLVGDCLHVTNVTVAEWNDQSIEGIVPNYGDEQPTTNTLIIRSLADFTAFRNNVNSGNNYAGWKIFLENDITLSGEWTPIGNTSVRAFQGAFYGRGHTVSGLSISNNSDYQALFGFTGTGSRIEQLNVSGSVSSHTNVAGVVADNQGTIDGCSFTGNVKAVTEVWGGDAIAGGIVATNSGIIANCVSNGNGGEDGIRAVVDFFGGDVYAGGIAGRNSGRVVSCYNRATISRGGPLFSSYNVGGVAGSSSGSGAVVSTSYYWTGVGVSRVVGTTSTNPLGTGSFADQSYFTSSVCYNMNTASADYSNYAFTYVEGAYPSLSAK